MKKILGALSFIIIVVILIMLFFGKGAGLGNGFRNLIQKEGQDEVVDQNDSVTSNIDEESEANDEIDNTLVKVNVVENDYFYENEKISLEELLIKLKSIRQDFTVEINDENASKNAYEALINAFKENSIKYVEN